MWRIALEVTRFCQISESWRVPSVSRTTLPPSWQRREITAAAPSWQLRHRHLSSHMVRQCNIPIPYAFHSLPSLSLSSWFKDVDDEHVNTSSIKPSFFIGDATPSDDEEKVVVKKKKKKKKNVLEENPADVGDSPEEDEELRQRQQRKVTLSSCPLSYWVHYIQIDLGKETAEEGKIKACGTACWEHKW